MDALKSFSDQRTEKEADVKGAVSSNRGKTEKKTIRSANAFSRPVVIPQKKLEMEPLAISGSSAPTSSHECSGVYLQNRKITPTEIQLLKLDKASPSESSFKFFLENIGKIFNFESISVESRALTLPLLLPDGRLYERVRTIACSDAKKVQEKILSLSEKELLFVIRYSDESYGGENIFVIKLCLVGKENSIYDENIEEYLCCRDYKNNNASLFGFSFALNLDNHFELNSVEPHRTVRVDMQRKGISNDVSTNILNQIYKFLGNDETTIVSGNSIHIGTVKYFYPLNMFYRKSDGFSIRDINPSTSSLSIDDIIRGEDCLDDFEFYPGENTATCLTNRINLKTLLLQHKLRKVLDSRDEVLAAIP